MRGLILTTAIVSSLVIAGCGSDDGNASAATIEASATSWPWRASSIAVAAPAHLAPTTTTSHCWDDVVRVHVHDSERDRTNGLGGFVKMSWLSSAAAAALHRPVA